MSGFLVFCCVFRRTKKISLVNLRVLLIIVQRLETTITLLSLQMRHYIILFNVILFTAKQLSRWLFRWNKNVEVSTLTSLQNEFVVVSQITELMDASTITHLKND